MSIYSRNNINKYFGGGDEEKGVQGFQKNGEGYSKK